MTEGEGQEPKTPDDPHMQEPQAPEEPQAQEPPPRVPQPSVWVVLAGVYYAIVLIVSYGSVGVLGVFAALDALKHPWDAWTTAQLLCSFAGVTAPIAVIATVVIGSRRRAAMDAMRNAYALLVLVVMPVWGILLNHGLSASCVLDGCGTGDVGEVRSLGEPGVLVMAGLQAVVVLAYAVSRRRPEALHPQAEPWVHAVLLAGIVMHAVIATHFAGDVVVGLLVYPVGGAAVSPLLTIVLLTVELRARLRRRGAEAAQPPPVKVSDPFRGAEVHAAPASPRVNVRVLAGSVARVPVVLGVYALVAGLIQHDRYGAVAAFTRTCGHTFSQIPFQTIPHGDCHYLCTVAARGHRWLARPERIGVRRGQPIIVNRQLAIANAFEDLLHERWPRLGAVARRTYDRLGYPVSQLIRGPWLADMILVLMKPAELCFYLCLLLADRRSPEERISRMYR